LPAAPCLQVDRVLAVRTVSAREITKAQQHMMAAGLMSKEPRSGVEYLVSWRELPLDQASWEAEEVRGAAAGSCMFACWLLLSICTS
jgi:hypothetical protein